MFGLDRRPAPGECGENEDCSERKTGCITPRPPDWAHLRVHSHPSPRAIHLGAAHLCSHCGAPLLGGETESLCCGNGRITTTPLPTLREGWEEMFRTPAFRTHSRQYNNLLTFTALGVSGDEGFAHQPVPSCVKIHGRTYHRVLPAEMQGPVHWYVHDPEELKPTPGLWTLLDQM